MTPPTSSSLNAAQLLVRSFVKTPVWSPNDESLTWRIASPKSRNGKATTSGANASFEQTAAVTGVSVRIVGGNARPLGLTAEEQLAAELDGLVDPALGPAPPR